MNYISAPTSYTRKLEGLIKAEPNKQKRAFYGEIFHAVQLQDELGTRLPNSMGEITEAFLLTMNKLDELTENLTVKELKPLESKLGLKPNSLSDPYSRIEAGMSLTMRALSEMEGRTRDVKQFFGTLFLGVLIDIIRKGLDRV